MSENKAKYLLAVSLIGIIASLYFVSSYCHIDSCPTTIQFFSYGIFFLFLFFLDKSISILYKSNKKIVEKAGLELKKFATKANLIYQPVSAPKRDPLYQNSPLYLQNRDDEEEMIYQETPDIKHLVKGKYYGEYVEIYIQKAVLDLGRGNQEKEYLVFETNSGSRYADIKFFIKPKRRNKIIYYLSKLSAATSSALWEKVEIESNEFSQKYDIWFEKTKKKKAMPIFQAIGPAIAAKLLDKSTPPIYLEVVYDRLRIFASPKKLNEEKIIKLLKILLDIENNINPEKAF